MASFRAGRRVWDARTGHQDVRTVTDPRNRQRDRAAREWQRQHPDSSLAQARQAVADRSVQPPARPELLPSAPQPHPGETLAGYVDRVAAALGIGRHRAMERLGLQPGTSAAARLADLTDRGLPEQAAAALSAAAGITPAQAHALAAPGRDAPATPPAPGMAPAELEQAVRRITERVLTEGTLRRGGADKTSTTTALGFGPRAQLVDLDSQPTAATPARPWTPPAGHGPSAADTSPWMLLDTAMAGPLPADPDLLRALADRPGAAQPTDQQLPAPAAPTDAAAAETPGAPAVPAPTLSPARAHQAVRDSYRSYSLFERGAWTVASVRLLPEVLSALQAQARLDRTNPAFTVGDPGIGVYLDAALRTGPRTHQAQLALAHDLLERPDRSRPVNLRLSPEAHVISPRSSRTRRREQHTSSCRRSPRTSSSSTRRVPGPDAPRPTAAPAPAVTTRYIAGPLPAGGGQGPAQP